MGMIVSSTSFALEFPLPLLRFTRVFLALWSMVKKDASVLGMGLGNVYENYLPN